MQTTPIAITAVVKHEMQMDHSQVRKYKAPVHVTQPTTLKDSCSLCKGSQHSLYLCPSFKAINTDNRKVHVRNSNAYFICLGQGHRTKDCKSTGCCINCSKFHHTLLYRDQASNESDETKSSLHVTIHLQLSQVTIHLIVQPCIT